MKDRNIFTSITVPDPNVSSSSIDTSNGTETIVKTTASTLLAGALQRMPSSSQSVSEDPGAKTLRTRGTVKSYKDSFVSSSSDEDTDEINSSDDDESAEPSHTGCPKKNATLTHPK